MHLQQRKVVAEADALARGKGMVRVGMLRGLAVRGPAVGVERERILPERAVAVGEVRREHDRSARGDGVAAQRIVLNGIPDIERRGRVETQDLLDHLERVRQPRQVLQGGVAVAQGRVELGVQPVRDRRVGRQRVPGRGHRPGGGLVPGKEHGDGLVAQEGRGHGCAGLLVARLHQPGQEVVGPLALGQAAAAGDDAVDVGVHLLPRDAVRPVEVSGRPQRQGQARLPRGDEADHGFDRVLHVDDGVVGLGAEERTKDDPGRDQRHLVAHLDGLAAAGQALPAVQQAHAVAEHDRGVGLHPARGKEGRHELALAPPQLARARDEPVPENEAPYGVVAAGLVVGLPLRDVHMAHRVRVQREDQRARPQAEPEGVAMRLPQAADVTEEALPAQAGQRGERAGAGQRCALSNLHCQPFHPLTSSRSAVPSVAVATLSCPLAT